MHGIDVVQRERLEDGAKLVKAVGTVAEHTAGRG
jgi:hypothetical protein